MTRPASRLLRWQQPPLFSSPTVGRDRDRRDGAKACVDEPGIHLGWPQHLQKRVPPKDDTKHRACWVPHRKCHHTVQQRCHIPPLVTSRPCHRAQL